MRISQLVKFNSVLMSCFIYLVSFLIETALKIKKLFPNNRLKTITFSSIFWHLFIFNSLSTLSMLQIKRLMKTQNDIIAKKTGLSSLSLSLKFSSMLRHRRKRYGAPLNSGPSAIADLARQPLFSSLLSHHINQRLQALRQLSNERKIHICSLPSFLLWPIDFSWFLGVNSVWKIDYFSNSHGVSASRLQALPSSVSMWTSSLKLGSTRAVTPSSISPQGPPILSFISAPFFTL